ncbi:exopolysaccharide biosynthesis protein [Afifella pfennigii]|uniref:exopolysaccharide biosynthesis protein n=1 Tax=Afifella pfennigii TaxID=209897 RepID=UPI0005511814|nr:exopolysaccharide biosynthesis protein [Afifella pfennigii]
MPDDPHSVSDILQRLHQRAQNRGCVTLGDLADAVGARSYGPFLIIPSLVELTPIGAIPGVPTALAAFIVVFAAQMLVGRKHLWLPTFVSRRRIGGERVTGILDRMEKPARRFDRWFHGRLTALTSAPFVRLAAAVCILLAATVPPLELIPFASSAPMLAIAAIGVAVMVRDGALMVAAVGLAGLALGFSASYLLPGGI